MRRVTGEPTTRLCVSWPNMGGTWGYAEIDYSSRHVAYEIADKHKFRDHPCVVYDLRKPVPADVQAQIGSMKERAGIPNREIVSCRIVRHEVSETIPF